MLDAALAAASGPRSPSSTASVTRSSARSSSRRLLRRGATSRPATARRTTSACARATPASSCAVADDAYVFHAKSRSLHPGGAKRDRQAQLRALPREARRARRSRRWWTSWRPDRRSPRLGTRSAALASPRQLVSCVEERAAGPAAAPSCCRASPRAAPAARTPSTRRSAGLRRLGVPARIASRDRRLDGALPPTRTPTSVFSPFSRRRTSSASDAEDADVIVATHSHPSRCWRGPARGAARLPARLLRPGLRAVLPRPRDRSGLHGRSRPTPLFPTLPVRQDALAVQRRRAAPTGRRWHKVEPSIDRAVYSAEGRPRVPGPCGSRRWWPRTPRRQPGATLARSARWRPSGGRRSASPPSAARNMNWTSSARTSGSATRVCSRATVSPTCCAHRRLPRRLDLPGVRPDRSGGDGVRGHRDRARLGGA